MTPWTVHGGLGRGQFVFSITIIHRSPSPKNNLVKPFTDSKILETNADMIIFPEDRHGRGQITDTRVHRTLVSGYGLWLHYPSLSVNVVKSIKLKGDR